MKTTHDLDATWSSGRTILTALLAACARLGVVAAVAAWLVILLLHEVAAALVYVIAAVLALVFFSCPG